MENISKLLQAFLDALSAPDFPAVQFVPIGERNVINHTDEVQSRFNLVCLPGCCSYKLGYRFDEVFKKEVETRKSGLTSCPSFPRLPISPFKPSMP